MQLNNRTAIITGARRGIGRAIALAMAKEGANIVVSDVNLEDCQKVVDEISTMGGKALGVKCNVAMRSEVEDLVNRTVTEFGRVDILVNNAAIISFKPFLQITEDEWDNTINVNLKGQFLCAQAAAKEMIKNKWGRIINIAALAYKSAGIAFPVIAHYTASKGGVVSLTGALALELTPLGINVNAICPGATETAMAKGDEASAYQLKQIISRIPKGRIGQCSRLRALYLLLANCL